MQEEREEMEEKEEDTEKREDFRSGTGGFGSDPGRMAGGEGPWPDRKVGGRGRDLRGEEAGVEGVVGLFDWLA